MIAVSKCIGSMNLSILQTKFCNRSPGDSLPQLEMHMQFPLEASFKCEAPEQPMRLTRRKNKNRFAKGSARIRLTRRIDRFGAILCAFEPCFGRGYSRRHPSTIKHVTAKAPTITARKIPSIISPQIRTRSSTGYVGYPIPDRIRLG